MSLCCRVSRPSLSHRALSLVALIMLPAGYLFAAQSPVPDSPPTQRQMQLFSSNCLQCHARAGIGAPLIGNAQDWQARQAQGEQVMLQNVVEGIRGMPPLGYCSACDEADFRVLIRLLLPNTEQQP